jgi:hypothetical protein
MGKCGSLVVVGFVLNILVCQTLSRQQLDTNIASPGAMVSALCTAIE